ncbi:MAG: nucleotidyltransferase domain-containing protein [Prevotellaceae bacterium]|jgi:predicted nucleotidyltransferase|nr:nucleotidyltransferase domain-containing protein [Prevotellaceae bacterium]
MNELIEKNKSKIIAVCRQQHILTLCVFGSALTDKFNTDSDIDLLVSFEPLDFGEYTDNYFQTVERFEQIFSRPVDLVTDKSLGNPYFIHSINTTKKQIYG